MLLAGRFARRPTDTRSRRAACLSAPVAGRANRRSRSSLLRVRAHPDPSLNSLRRLDGTRYREHETRYAKRLHLYRVVSQYFVVSQLPAQDF